MEEEVVLRGDERDMPDFGIEVLQDADRLEGDSQTISLPIDTESANLGVR